MTAGKFLSRRCQCLCECGRHAVEGCTIWQQVGVLWGRWMACKQCADEALGMEALLA